MRPVCTKSKRGAKYLTKPASCKQRRGLLPKDNLTKCKEWVEAKFLLFGISLFILCNYLLISKEFYERSKFLCPIA